MHEISHRFVQTNGIRMHLAEVGTGPLVVLCHGFPESWYSWRHQLQALAEAGFHAVAPDMRGYGQTDRPTATDKYTLLHLTGDMVGLNWYRNHDLSWEMLAPFAGARVTVPALYIAGDRDLVVHFRGMDQLIANLRHFVPQLHSTIILPGCGHWTQQERVSEVNQAMIEFLRQLSEPSANTLD